MFRIGEPDVAQSSLDGLCFVTDDTNHDQAEVTVGLKQIDQTNRLVIGAYDRDSAAKHAPLTGTCKPCAEDGPGDAQQAEAGERSNDCVTHMPIEVTNPIAEKDDSSEDH